VLVIWVEIGNVPVTSLFLRQKLPRLWLHLTKEEIVMVTVGIFIFKRAVKGEHRRLVRRPIIQVAYL